MAAFASQMASADPAFRWGDPVTTIVNEPMSKDTIITIKPLYLARAEAAMYLSISDSMLDKLVAQGDAPKPRRISAGRTAWLVDELDAWGRARPVSDFVPPINSGYGRAGKPA